MVVSLVAALAWTLVSLVARDLTAQFPSLSLNIIRSAGASVILAPVALLFGDLTGLSHVSLFAWVCLVLSVLTALGIGDTAFFESTKSLGLARAMTISTAGYPLAGGLALWWFDERITLPLAVGSIVALAGLVLIVSESASGGAVPDSTEGRRHGLRLAVVAALAWAVSAALMKPPVREIDPLAIQAVRLPLSTVLLLWATP
jgi:drug/metabolite transporter (DMT)-like permease